MMRIFDKVARHSGKPYVFTISCDNQRLNFYTGMFSKMPREDKKAIEEIFLSYLDVSAASKKEETYSKESGVEMSSNEELINENLEKLLNPVSKEAALTFLCQNRFLIPNLASTLWNAFGVVTSFIYDISTAFSYVVTSTMEIPHCKKICCELALIHLMAINPETRPFLLKANLPIFLYPLVRSTCRTPQFDYIRLSCVLILSALVSFDDPETTAYVLSTELVPLCLSFLESDRLLCAIIAAKSIAKLLNDEVGLKYTCNTYDRFSRIVLSLSKVTNELLANPNVVLLKYILQCFYRLSTYSTADVDCRAVSALQRSIPSCLIDGSFDQLVENDEECKAALQQLVDAIIHLPKTTDVTTIPLDPNNLENNNQQSESSAGFGSVTIHH